MKSAPKHLRAGTPRISRVVSAITATTAAAAFFVPVAIGQDVWDPNLGVKLAGVSYPANGGGVTDLSTHDLDGGGPLPEMLYVTGNFDAAGDIWVDGLAAFDGANWQAVPRPFLGKGSITRLGNQFLLQGAFSATQGGSQYKFIVWDGADQWQPLDPLFLPASSVTGTQFVMHNGNAIFTGDFTSIAGVAANKIASFDGQTWSNLGSGISRVVKAMDFQGQLLLHSCEPFVAGSVQVSQFASWNGTQWDAREDLNFPSEIANCPSVHSTGQQLQGLTGWQGAGQYWQLLHTYNSQWLENRAYTNGSIGSLQLLNNTMFGVFHPGPPTWPYEGSTFTTVDSINPLPATISSKGVLRRVAQLGSNYYVGGSFEDLNGYPVSGIGVVRSDPRMVMGASSLPVLGMYFEPSGSMIVARRAFLDHDRQFGALQFERVDANGITVLAQLAVDHPRVATYRNNFYIAGSNISPQRFTGSSVAPFAAQVPAPYHQHNNIEYSSGAATSSSATPYAMLMRQASGYQTWFNLDGGPGNAITTFNGQLYIAGSFRGPSALSRIPSDYISRLDGATWRPVGLGLNGPVSQMVIYRRELIAFGSFTSAGGVSVQGVAGWDGQSWRAVDIAPLPNRPQTIKNVVAYNNQLYLTVNQFVPGQGIPERGIASLLRLEDGQWTPIPGSPTQSIQTLTVRNGKLYMSGGFRSVSGMVSTGLASLSTNPNSSGLAQSDLDENGGIDGEDVETFFELWNNASTRADLNDDGQITQADVDQFFELWSNGM